MAAQGRNKKINLNSIKKLKKEHQWQLKVRIKQLRIKIKFKKLEIDTRSTNGSSTY